ncbi:MAG TPA: hypothetical protein VKY85_12285 [Candidatus Angelobacter sp.]|nr:hypothetical protein [Candidatus Angelobacter sp.]
MTTDFEEISHSGGKITFHIVTDQNGQRGYQVTYMGDRPVPFKLIAIYALPQGVAVESIQLGGIGQPFNPAPFPGCFPVFIASDSQGQFGHHCPSCGGYWRSGPWPNICPYCALRAAGFQFLSEAQQRYVEHYCKVLSEALGSKQDGNVVIDMDAVADAVGKEGEKPAFYVSEQSQQRKFTCTACDEYNDILGRFGYCSLCGTRNDLADFEQQTAPAIRTRLNSDHTPEDCVRDAVASFDSFMAQVARELAKMVPLTAGRRQRLLTQSFHNLGEVRPTFKDWFDIDVCAGMKEEECRSVQLMFYRRHVYEHNGGEVDQNYLDRSGDTSVVLKQHIHETKQGAHDLLSSLVKMARNVHAAFHELFPPIVEPIKAFEKRKAITAKYTGGGV